MRDSIIFDPEGPAGQSRVDGVPSGTWSGRTAEPRPPVPPCARGEPARAFSAAEAGRGPGPDLSGFLAGCSGAFDRALRERGPARERSLAMAGVGVRLRFAGSGPAEATLPALAHLPAGDPSGPTVTFDIWDGTATAVLPPRPPFSAADYRRYGRRAVACAGRVSLMHAPDVPILFAYDRSARHGFCWTAEASRLSIYERAAPLQTLFHWALGEFGWRIVHAAGVGTEAGGVLLVGNSGAGKSTTALGCIAGGDLRLLSDDKCLARLEPGPQAFASFSSGKIKADMLGRLPHLRDRLRGWDPGAGADKGLVFLHPDFADRLVPTFPIRALVVPNTGSRAAPAVRPMSAGEAFRVFGPGTVVWLPGAEADSYRFTAELTRRLPCYRLDLAQEPAANVEALLRLLADSPARPGGPGDGA